MSESGQLFNRGLDICGTGKLPLSTVFLIFGLKIQTGYSKGRRPGRTLDARYRKNIRRAFAGPGPQILLNHSIFKGFKNSQMINLNYDITT